VAGRSAVDLSAELWAWLRKTWRVRKVLVLCFAGGLIGGFAMGVGPTAEDDLPAPVPVDMTVHVNSHGVSSTMDKGWSRPQGWGRWMTAGSASILLGFDGPVRGDVELLVEARARLAEGQPQPTLIVRFNDAELGRWQLPTEERDLRRRFIVPVGAFNKSMAAKLNFALEGRAPLTPMFGLEAVSLRDARFLVDYKGFIDECRDGTFSGWAVAEGTAVSVAASIDGSPVAARLVNTHRPDLAAHGLPDDAGVQADVDRAGA
jgi:hypothetical protein